MSVAVRRALYGKMAGDTTLTNLLGDAPPGVTHGIYHAIAPEGAEFPYVIFQKSAGTPTYAFGERAYEDEVWMVKGVDDSGDADIVDTIDLRLDTLLTDGTISISANTQLYLRREGDMGYPETVDGVRYHHAGALYRLVFAAT